MTTKGTIKRLVHFSDLHIRLFKDHELYKKILEQALSEWKSLAPDRIVFSGDLVHSKNQVSPELIEFVSWILTECSKIAKTILIIGNHDMIESNLERLDTLTPIINSLNNPNISYYKDRGVYEDENVNWCVYSLVQHNIPPDITKSDKINIGLFHGPIQGLYTDIGFKFEDGFDADKFKGCDLVLCGDIHKRQVFDIPGGKKAYMVGSTIQQNFGETIRNHGYGVYDVENDDYQFVDLPNPKPFLKFYMDSIDVLMEGNEKLINY
jgi:DNA repair exonuclease SbcCD nuclease subunit